MHVGRVADMAAYVFVRPCLQRILTSTTLCRLVGWTSKPEAPCSPCIVQVQLARVGGHTSGIQ